MEYLSVVLAQLLYTSSDTMKKIILDAQGFSASLLLRPAFILTLLIAAVGFILQMYALSKVELSRTIIMMGMLAVIFSALAGGLFLGEKFNTWNIFGIVFALLAIAMINIR